MTQAATGANAVVATRHPATVWCNDRVTGSSASTGWNDSIVSRCLATLNDSACPGHDPGPVGARRCEHAVVPGQVRGIAVFVIPVFFLYQYIVANSGVGLSMTVIMVIAGFLFSSVAAYMAGLVGCC